MSKSLTRSFLKALGLTEDQQTSIMEQHSAVLDEIKAERDSYKADADKLQTVQRELETYKSEDYKAKYEAEHQAFDTYKAQVAQEAETAKVKAAYRKLLTDEHINEKRLDGIIRLTDFSQIKLDKDGNLANIDALKDAIGKEWGEYKVTTEQRTQKVETPPVIDNGGSDTGIRAMTAKWHEARYGKPTNGKD